MQVVKDINNLHEDTLPTKLELGQVVRYQLTIGQVNPDPEARLKRPVIYPTVYQIKSTDRIYDPNKKKHVSIALVENFDQDKGTIQAKPIYVYSTDRGQISCTGGNVEDEELYEYLELTNLNESNPNRDKSILPVFKRIDDQGDAKQRSKKRNTLKEALTYAMGMTAGEVKTFAASVNWNENDPLEVLRDRIEEYAQSKPDEFIKLVGSKDRDIKAVIKRAIDNGKLSYDTAQHRITLNGQTLIKLERVDGMDYLTQAAEYCQFNQKGAKVLDTIKKLGAEPTPA